jgi:uncharacterized protein
VFIHQMSDDECRQVLERASIGRLACARDNQPYVVPINFAFDGLYLYGFTTLGQKIEWLRLNPLVCFEVDEVTNDNEWTSVIAFGRYEELPDIPEYKTARKRAHKALQKRPIWWEPAYISQKHRDRPHSLTPIFYRISINKLTGQRATSDQSEATLATPENPSGKRGEHTERSGGYYRRSMTLLKAAVVYFSLVFGAGLVFGPIRVLLVVPYLGERLAELLEAPLMLIVILLAARWVIHRFQLPPEPIDRLGVGLIALTLGLLFEFTLVVYPARADIGRILSDARSSFRKRLLLNSLAIRLNAPARQTAP